jgi:hypothetical protein
MDLRRLTTVFCQENQNFNNLWKIQKFLSHDLRFKKKLQCCRELVSVDNEDDAKLEAKILAEADLQQRLMESAKLRNDLQNSRQFSQGFHQVLNQDRITNETLCLRCNLLVRRWRIIIRISSTIPQGLPRCHYHRPGTLDQLN